MDQSVFEFFLHTLQVWPIPLMRSLCFMGKGTPGVSTKYTEIETST